MVEQVVDGAGCAVEVAVEIGTFDEAARRTVVFGWIFLQADEGKRFATAGTDVVVWLRSGYSWIGHGLNPFS